jgi:alpha-galactosidase
MLKIIEDPTKFLSTIQIGITLAGFLGSAFAADNFAERLSGFVVKTFDEVVGMSDNISYVKWDANRHVDNVGSTYLPSDRQTHFWYEYVRGLYDVYERIRAKHPDIMIQLCSSGGGRLDYGALKYHDEFWASDNTNALLPSNITSLGVLT